MIRSVSPTIRATAVRILPAALTLLLGACASMPAGGQAGGDAATARLVPTTGSRVSGSARFEPVSDGVRVVVEVAGLAPGSEHGFHVHEKGDCSSGDGMSAGGHFNPTGMPHGSAGAAMHHAGDLPSLKADAGGVARLNFVSSSIALSGPTSVVGRGLIVHRDPDDFTTQPTGNSGPRLACGVIAKS